MKETNWRCQRRSNSGCSLLTCNSKLWQSKVVNLSGKTDSTLKLILDISLYTYENTFQIVLQENLLHVPGVWGIIDAMFSLPHSLWLFVISSMTFVTYLKPVLGSILPNNICVFCHAANIFTSPSGRMKHIFINSKRIF